MIADAEQRRPVHPWWLLLVVPLCVLGVTSALLGFILERAYARETSAWVLQAHAQDAANLAIGLPVIAIAAWFAARGSLAAMCVMLGAIVNIVYAAVIYAFGVHFGPLFLLHVAILSVSTWSLVGGIAALDRERISAKMSTRPPPPWVGALIVGVAVLFTGLWLSQIVPANLAGRIPSELQEVGLATNPVHVLDLAYLLPLSYVAGVSLMLRR
ncbi:MAG: hypothetical protein JWM90_1935, partial [Thermoleophilia bacterium]|nr:hypothetical protein [Thermoleophilia bacterium]